jgi:hypothetical protein
MKSAIRFGTLGLLALLSLSIQWKARADDNPPFKTVFVIAMENHNWTQPNTQTSPEQIFQNPAAPFINSLVNGTSGISDQVAFANGYINAGQGVHPSEPNYIWAEAGTNFGREQ